MLSFFCRNSILIKVQLALYPLLYRIHLYSDMWRHFDTGLHEFMHTYIYQPIVGSHPSFLGIGIQQLFTICRYKGLYHENSLG